MMMAMVYHKYNLLNVPCLHVYFDRVMLKGVKKEEWKELSKSIRIPA